MTLSARCAWLAFSSALALSHPVIAVGDDWGAFERVSDDQLEDQRGGFLVADGISFDFGAVMRTTVNGELVMETTLNWTAAGPVTQQTIANPTLASAYSIVQSAVPDGSLSQISGAGVVLAGGPPQLIQQISQNGLQNIILNTADNQNLRQDLEVNLTVGQAAAFQNMVSSALQQLMVERAAAQSASSLH